MRNDELDIVKVPGVENPADLFTKPLTPLQFTSCRARIPGIYWGESDSNIEEEHEVQMIEFEDNEVTVK